MPQPAAASARAATEGDRGESLHEPSEVLDCGTKTVADSTSHTVVAVVMRARGGRLEALLAARVRARSPRRVARAARSRARSTSRALAHLEQLETRILRDGTLATAYLGLARPDAELDGDWRAVGARTPADERGARRRGAGAPAREALVHEPRLRARAGGVHDLGAARDVRRGARPRRVGDEPAARARCAAACSSASTATAPPGRTGGRPAALFRFASQRLEVTDEFAALGRRADGSGDSPRTCLGDCRRRRERLSWGQSRTLAQRRLRGCRASG